MQATALVLQVLVLVTLGVAAPGVEAQRPRPFPTVGEIGCGDVHHGSIDAPGEVDVMWFRGNAGDRVGVALVGTFPGGYQCATVRAPSGSAVASFCSDGLEDLVLPETGRYSVRVTAWDLVFTGPYALGLSCLDPLAPVAAELGCGDVVTNALAGPAQAHWYAFQGSAGQAVDVALVGTVPGGYQCATVFAPGGAVVASFCSDLLQEIVLTETGRHAIRVVSWDLVFTGDYHVALSCRDPLGPVVADLACGDLVHADLSRPAEIDWFAFDGNAGQTVEVVLVGTTPGGDQCATVFAPSGAPIDSFCSDDLRTLVLAETGRYSIRVHAWDFRLMGPYHVALACP
jgi:hypothetical protein